MKNVGGVPSGGYRHLRELWFILDPEIPDLIAQGGTRDLEGLGSAGDVPLEALQGSYDVFLFYLLQGESFLGLVRELQGKVSPLDD
jgi:hypothetical protein